MEELRAEVEAAKLERKSLKEKLRNVVLEQGKTGRNYQLKLIEKLEKQLYIIRKEYDDKANEVTRLMAEIKIKRDKFKDVKKESAPLLTNESPVAKQIRMLENRLDKAMIKSNEAASIRKTYEQIEQRLKEERLGFDNQLQAIEKTLKAKERDFQELKNMLHDAEYLKEQAKAELQKKSNEFEDMKKHKEKQVKEKKQYVQARTQLTATLSRKNSASTTKRDEQFGGEASDDPNRSFSKDAQSANAAQESKEDQELEKLSKLEETWRKLKELTAANDANEVIQKFLSSNHTSKDLRNMTREGQAKIDNLSQKKAILKAKLEEAKYSQNSGGKNKRIIEDFEQQLTDSKAKLEKNQKQYERIAKILANVKAGVEHIVFEKLKHIDDGQDLKATIESLGGTEERVLLELFSATEKKVKLLMESNPDSEEAQQETPLPPSSPTRLSEHNIRLKIEDDDDDESRNVESEGEEEGDVLDREKVKRLARQTMEKNRKKNKKQKS